MSKPGIKDLAASVRARLLNKARETNRPFRELLQYYAIERFLYRLSRTPNAERYILKGALMLLVWKAPQFRPTLDIDLLGKTNNEVNSTVDAIRSICVQKVEPDGLEFDISDIKGVRIKEDAEYEGVRVKFGALLNRARIPMQIDIAFGDEIMPGPETVDYPTILDFPKPTLKGYSKESLVAEKFEAMIKLGILNSRMKDFYDIYFLCRHFDFDGELLAEAITMTFNIRGTKMTDNPIVFSDEFIKDPSKATQWRAFIKKNRIADAPEEIKMVIEITRDFLMPVVKSILENSSFDKQWNTAGKWE